MQLMRCLVVAALFAGAATGVARVHAQQTIKFETSGTSAEEMIIKLFKQSGENVIIEPVAQCARRISVSVEGVPFEEALKQICESAELAWSKRGAVYIISCADRRSTLMNRGFLSYSTPRSLTMSAMSIVPPAFGDFRSRSFNPLTFAQAGNGAFLLPPTINGAPHPVTRARSATAHAPSIVVFDGGRYFMASEERSTFACPHCKKSVTIVGKKGACPKCNRTFQQDWAYCPFDGTKRTLPLDEWKVCPFCTKGVK